MQLSKLEIRGFKSFADKTTIHFDKGVTGIVGPNGCGKSNIVDAIRWVLGEQKTTILRSKKMEEIIFNGASQRAPLQLAEVSLTINNTKNILATEYSQVTITRRLYRSGESEYLLNRVPCRLKDITDLFLNTGISFNTYAIIELSMVDDLLNDHENARRVLFEEASGVYKFKKRKKETLRKIEGMDSDLERVEDLLFEIEKNMKSLEKQAKQANIYYKNKEAYKQKSIQLAKIILQKHKHTLSSTNEKIASKNDEKTKIIVGIAEQEAAIEKFKATLDEKEKTLSTQQENINQYVNDIRGYENEKQIKNERLQFLHDKSDRLKELIEELKKNNKGIQLIIQNFEEEKIISQKQQQETDKKRETFQSEYENQKKNTLALQGTVDELRNIYQENHNKSHELNKELGIKEAQISSLKHESERTDFDTHQQHTSIENLEKELLTLENQITEKTKQLESLEEKESEIEKQITTLEDTMGAIHKKITEASRQLDARQNEYQLTQSLVENMEGFPEAIKFLTKDAKWGTHVPLLSDIISTEENFRITLENYLEPYLNYYIVEHKKDAYEAINMLRQANKGKANFFIMNAFKTFRPSPINTYPNAFPATQIVECDEKYHKLMAYLLDKVYIYEGKMDAITEDEDNIFITPGGEITRKPFVLSGGSIGLFEGKKIGRAKNLKKLSETIKSLSQDIETMRENLSEKQKNLNDLHHNRHKQQIETTQNDINTIREKFISLNTKKEQLVHILSTTGIRQSDIQKKIETLIHELEEKRPQTESILKNLTEHEQKLEQKISELKDQNEILNQKLTALNKQNILSHQQENKTQSTEREIQFRKESIEQNLIQIKTNEEELKTNEEETKTFVETIQHNNETLIRMYAQKEKLEQQLNQAEKEYYTTREKREQMDAALRETQHQRQDVDTALMALQNELSESMIHLNSVKERLSVEFKINLDQLLKQDNETEQEENVADETTLHDEVMNIREKIEKMDPVNPMALEAYNEIKKRNDFINDQKDDLIKAKQSLLNTVNEIEEAANQTFMEAFHKIKEHFINVFQSLFNEDDDCDLKLSNPDNPLESKVEIIAKPKGKRPLTINQLSGGEKTLTATALLFSMYLLKPSHFCIFDEIDAPLDDVNINKFNKIVRRFSQDNQFIIVTHNKRTMTNTDVIYGITMVDKGVSKVIPASLRELHN